MQVGEYSMTGGWDGFGYERCFCRERQLELVQRELEREHLESQRQQVERRQTGVFSRNYFISASH